MKKVVINGQTSAIINHTDNYTAYISPYFVVNKGRFTKHYFEGTSRIVSKLGEGTFTQPAQINAGGINFIRQSALMQQARDKYIQSLGVPPGPPTQHGIYATPEYTGQPYPSIDWKDISQNQEPPEGWPRPPKFNPPGDVPGPPVQFGEPISPDTAQGGFGFIPNGIREKNIFFYHPDHLGSSSYITGNDGKVSQHTEYIAFGEILFDEHSSEHTMPYLFNGKELDQETGLYYYGARYYDPKVSIFVNVDPLAILYPNKSPYHFVSNNPINRIDPLGLTDYKVNGETKTIDDGHNDLSIKVSAREFNRLQRKFNAGITGYERYMNKLSIQNGYTTFETLGESYTDVNGINNIGGLSITHHKAGGQSYSEWSISNRAPHYSKVENTIRTLDAGFSSTTNQLKNVNIGSNGKWYYRQNSKRIFSGNQYVSTTSGTIKYARFAKGIKIGGIATGIALGAYEIRQGYIQDGGYFGYNAQVQTVGVIGGMAGAWAGAELGASGGAAIGALFGGVGAIPGGIIGGLIGGAIGAWSGDYYGELAAKELTK